MLNRMDNCTVTYSNEKKCNAVAQQPLRKLCAFIGSLGLICSLTSAEAWPQRYPERTRGESAETEAPIEIPSAGRIEVAFSPNEGSMVLVVKVIDSARTSLDMLAYNLTSARTVNALIRARQRGVVEHIVVDEKQNIDNDRFGKSKAALDALVRAGADVRVTHAYLDHHDKSLVVDGQTCELGSLNFSESAAHENSEVAFVNWNNPSLASALLKHFQRNYAQSQPYVAR